MLRLTLAIVLAATACGMPRDPDGTLDRVRGGRLRVGVPEAPPWSTWRDGDPSGSEVAIAGALARSLDSDVVHVRGSTPELLKRLEEGELDMVVGGLLADDPWVDRVAFTRPYLEGKHVLALPRGENAWLVHVERFLHERYA